MAALWQAVCNNIRRSPNVNLWDVCVREANVWSLCTALYRVHVGNRRDSYVDMCHVDVCHVDVCHVGVRDVDVKHEYSHMGWWTSLSGTQCFRMGRCADRTVVAGS